MAKQSGIHQLRGKVGEMSYYRQKGVESGLARSINQGLSERVKTDEAYANTRLNNAEFKNGNAIATAAYNSVNNRKRGMMRTFAISRMTKRALEDIKAGTGQWGVRLPLTNLDVLICDMLENYAKGGKYDGQYGMISADSLDYQGYVELVFSISETLATELVGRGITDLEFVFSSCLAGEIVVDGLPRLFAGNGVGDRFNVTLDAGSDFEKTFPLNFSTPVNVGMSFSGYEFAKQDPKHGFYAVITIIPKREVAGNLYPLQELATYVAIPLGQIPEEQP